MVILGQGKYKLIPSKSLSPQQVNKELLYAYLEHS
jgi:hypothetical protein